MQSKTILNKLLLAFVLSLFAINSLLSQDIWYNVVSIPPSPNASSIAKFGDYPVDKSTGVPTISIPFYEINYGGIKIPISVNYHASGIKVTDIESWVGMGWSLNAGGSITRVVKGLPDEKQYGYLYWNGNIPIKEEIDARRSSQSCTLIDSLEFMANNDWDYEPDIFYYNLPNFSGSFWIDKDKNCILRPGSNEKIIATITYNSFSIVIVDTEGNIYRFDEVETTLANIHDRDIPEYISTWYLTSISSHKTGKYIYFNYNTINTLTRSWNTSQSKTFKRLNTWTYEYIYGSERFETVTSAIRYIKYLSSIEFGDNMVTFSSSEAFVNQRQLNEVIVFSNSTIIKNYFLDHIIETSTFDKRLKLTSIREVGNGVENIYSFEYDNQLLPDRGSYSIDHWGYYNGQQNTELIPAQQFSYQVLCSADRNPHWPYTQAGILKKIIYPTGGYTEFEYENNAYSVTGNYPSQVKSFPLNVTGNYYAQNCINREIGWISSDSVYSDIKIITTVSAPEQQVAYFFNNLDRNISLGKQKGGPMYDKETILPEHYGRFDFRSSRMVYSIASQSQSFSQTMNSNEIVYYDSLIVDPGPPFEAPIDSLPDDNIYYYTACASDHLTTTNSVFTYQVRKEGITTYEIPAGGLRIKRIKSFDPYSQILSSKTYDYNLSGYLTGGYPTYSMDVKYYYNEGFNWAVKEEQRLLLYSHPVDGLGASSNSVSYQKVSEIFGTENNNIGKIETTFCPANDEGQVGYYYVPPVSNQWMRSKVSSETYFKRTETGYDTIYSKSNIYMLGPTKIDIGFKLTKTSTKDISGWVACGLYDDYNYNNFQIRSSELLCIKEIERNFYPDNLIVEKTNTFQYDSINFRHYFPIQTTTYNSDGKKIKTKIIYPTDTTSSLITDFMVANNIISYPLKKSIYVNSNKTEEYRWIYGKDNLGKLYLQTAEELIKKTPVNTFRPVMDYQRYDDFGNPTQILGKDGITKTYLWGYNGDYLIAIIENATLLEVTQALGGPIILENGKLSQNQENLIRSGLPLAMITTYTYNPLIGLSSITYPNGVKQYYEYDDFARLHFIRDDGNRILKSFEYNYANSIINENQ